VARIDSRKRLFFVKDIDHAERMRQALVNANPDLAAANSRYIMRITGDNEEGKAQLDNFIDPESTFPVIVTTSRLMTTGVDAQTCKLIVLDRRIASVAEFKQIIGRGTRINEYYNKMYFTIMDFKRATALFADPLFDGDPVQIYEPGPDESAVPPEDGPEEMKKEGAAELKVDSSETEGSDGQRRTKYYVDDVAVTVATERVQYLDANGKLITESLRDYTRKTVRKEFASPTSFLTTWNKAKRKQAIVEELALRGVFLDELAEQVGRDFDAFDLICHVAFDQPPLTRRERANNVRKRNVFAKYGGKTREVLNALLEKYADAGLSSVESLEILKVDPLRKFGTPIEIVNIFGGKEQYMAAVYELESQLYEGAA
jgi:type I restriction enzyme R subunit